MDSNSTGPTFTPARARPVTKVLVATTAMLAFISFWRAAAIVLNDLASSAYYAGGEAEQFIGKTAPWFILGIMLFSYAVRAIYVESCSMFVRGGVYRVVKEALGGTLAKFSVSALMFDYVLTGPISGVSAGQYLVGVINELFHHAGTTLHLNVDATAATVAIMITLYFWWENIKGVPESSDKALRIMQLTTMMVVVLIGWCFYTLWVRSGWRLPPLPQRAEHEARSRFARLAGPLSVGAHHHADYYFCRPGPFGAGDERRRIARAGVSRNRAPQAAESEESRPGYFHLQPGVHFAGFVFRGDDHSG